MEWEHWIKKMEAMQEEAAESESLDTTIYYGHRAICYGLTAILLELMKIRGELARK